MLRAFAAMIGAMLLAAFPLAAFAEADGPDYFRVEGVAKNDGLNIRVAPKATSRIIGVVPARADGLRNLGCRGGLSFGEWEKASEAERAAAQKRRWCRIDYRGRKGWVAARFLREGSAP